MLNGGAQLHQLVGEGVVDPPVGQEVHQVVVQGLHLKKNKKKQKTKTQQINEAVEYIITFNNNLIFQSYPVKRVCVERVAGLLPIRVSLRLETDFTDGKDVALLSFTVAHLHKSQSSCFFCRYISKNFIIWDQWQRGAGDS